MGLRTDIGRAFSCWSSGSQKVHGDPLRKAVSQLEWVGMNNTLVRNSLGENLLALQQQQQSLPSKDLSNYVLMKDICPDVWHRRCS